MEENTETGNVQDNLENAISDTENAQKSVNVNKEPDKENEDATETLGSDTEIERKSDEITKDTDMDKMDVDEESDAEKNDSVQKKEDTNPDESLKAPESEEMQSETIEKQDATKDDDASQDNEEEIDEISDNPKEDAECHETETNEDETRAEIHVTDENEDSNREIQSNNPLESTDSNAMEIGEMKEVESKEKEVENEDNEAQSKDNEDHIETVSKENTDENKDKDSDIDKVGDDANMDEEAQNSDKDEDEVTTDKEINQNKENQNHSDDDVPETNTDKDKDENEKNDEDDSKEKDEDETNTDKSDKNEDGVTQDVAMETVNVELSTSKENDNSQEIQQDQSNKDSDNCDGVTIDDDNSVFVQVNNEKDDSEKSTTITEQVTNDVDPIGSSDWSQNNENNENTFISDLDEADECIIPDTNRDESMAIESSKEPDTTADSTSESTTTTTTTLKSEKMKLSEKYLVSVSNTEEESACMICDEKKVCKYNCTKDEDKTFICTEDCLSKLKEEYNENVIVRQLRVKNFSLDKTLQPVAAIQVSESPKIICKHCDGIINDVGNSLSWEALDFCNEQCLTNHQKIIGSFCANCRIEVKENFLGKYCVRFGYNVRQFCSGTCLEQYKKNSKVCSYCQDDISGHMSGFLTSIGDKGMSKDFCSAQCMQKYNEISKHLKGGKTYEKCCVCHKHNVIEVEFEFKNKEVLFCSEPCFVAFKYVNDVNPEKCDMCCKYYTIKTPGITFFMRYDGVYRKFCQKTCQNIYITTNRKIVSCCWCKVKKYNFDMIQKFALDSSVLIVCSLTCLNFFNASMNAAKLKRKRCDFCHKVCKGQYHITLADDSMKNFCSYPCVQEYQAKYILAPARFSEQPVAVATNANVRVTRKTSGIQVQRKQIIPDVPGPLPIITSVRSLAPVSNASPNTRSLRSKSSIPNITTLTSLQSESPPVRRIIVLRPPELALQRNVATLVKPITADVEVEFKPVMVDKAVQTEDIKNSLVLVPIPVPIYVPSPMQMYNLVHPKPIPFPLPIPIPVFIPITKQTSNVVLKEIKKNHKNTPTDPYEADLLMMAELVAGENEKKDNAGESDADAESDGDNGNGINIKLIKKDEPSFSPEPQDGSNTFGDDMLQMALKMATDFDEPAVDLEGALTASTITATSAPNDQVDDVVPIQVPVERMTFRGRRRGRPPRHGGRRRGRGRPPTQPDIMLPIEPDPPQLPPEPVEKPDANMCLKYTFGVNAWKQWVTTKNAELEKSSRGTKSFKPDLMQLTSDELNYSLCLFVKEVRKPNGAEYAPDTIYYLCLGIQQYLFENGRIDNIFCDSYYESFTDCLDEVCKKFSTLYNDSQYIVTRVEEEHLWESKQLGAHSPHVLLTTLMFFNTKHFNLTNVDEHMQLSFSHIMKHWKRVPNQPGTPKNSSSRNILLRFYPPQSAVEGNNRKKKVYEQQENEENPLRCPVKLYEFYLSKCPESVKTRNDVFYLLPERSCVPDSPVWYSTMALGKEPLEKMLHRVKMVKEINVALLAS